MNDSVYSRVMVDESVEGDILVQLRVKQDYRWQMCPYCFDTVMVTQETPLPSRRYRRRSWGIFGWWERI